MNNQTEGQRLSEAIDAALRNLSASAYDCARTDHEYRKAHAEEYLQAEGKTVADREAEVYKKIGKLRLERELAEAKKLIAIESLRSHRQQMSYLQTLTNLNKAEAQLANGGRA